MAGVAPKERRTALQILSYIGLIYAALAWGSTFIMVKSAAMETGPLLLVAYRFGVAGLVMTLYLLLAGTPLFHHLRAGVGLGALIALMYITQTVGLVYTSATNSGFITGLFVVFLPLFVFLFERKGPTYRDGAVILLALLGLWLLTGGLHGANAGDLITVVAAAAYAAYIPLVDRALRDGARPFTLLTQSFVVTSAIAFLGAVMLRESFSAGNVNLWGVIIFLALVPSLSASLAQFFAQRYVLPLAVGATFLLEPVFATLFSVYWGKEPFSDMQFTGGLVILLAMAASVDWKRASRGEAA